MLDKVILSTDKVMLSLENDKNLAAESPSAINPSSNFQNLGQSDILTGDHTGEFNLEQFAGIG